MAADGAEYLSVDDVIAIHDFVLESMGDPYAPLRDVGLLEGAMARPRNAAVYAGAGVREQGCILMVAIAEAQPFLEGNKRTGMVAGLTFLERNGWRFLGDDVELAVLLAEAAEKPQEQAIADIYDWVSPYLHSIVTDETLS